MNRLTTKTSISIAAFSACLLAPGIGSAADTTKKAEAANRAAVEAPMSDPMAYSDRANMKSWSSDKEVLERELKLGEVKAHYIKALADRGFQITSINTDKPTSVEYEVVKGKQTYEVQVDFDKSGRATKVDVSSNMWRTDATKAALKGNKVATATAYQSGNEKYSDRGRMKAWTGEKDKLEKSLAMGHDKAYYEGQLKQLGYQITSVNKNEKDYVEYEVVKGNESYEVQIDFDNTGKAKAVDVAANMWQSAATEKALAGKK